MPEGLAEFFVRATCPQGGVVIDPFAGSGTTVVVARRLGRRAAGFELHAEFAAEAGRRIEKDQAVGAAGPRLTNGASWRTADASSRSSRPPSEMSPSTRALSGSA